MTFELTISGLCIIALKSAARDPNPAAVDIICPTAPMHKARLTYAPAQFGATIAPEMAVQSDGGRLASDDMSGKVYELSFGSSPIAGFTLTWGPPAAVQPGSEQWMNWIPTLDDLGFRTFDMGAPGTLPTSAATRFTLPPGELTARQMTQDRDGNLLIWHFPDAAGGRGVDQALANFVVYRAVGVSDPAISINGQVVLPALEGTGDPIQMCVSNDMETVPTTYNDPQTALDHLANLKSIAPLKGSQFHSPTLNGTARTAHPICNSVIYNYT